MTMGPGRSAPWVYARYHQAAATLQAFTSNSPATVNYDTNDLDSGGLATPAGFVAGGNVGVNIAGQSSFLVTTGSGWIFTCPYPGLYRVTAQVAWASVTWATTDSQQLIIQKNGANYSKTAPEPMWAAIAATPGLRLSDIVQCNHLDTLNIVANIVHVGGDTLIGDAAVNWVVIEKIE